MKREPAAHGAVLPRALAGDPRLQPGKLRSQRVGLDWRWGGVSQREGRWASPQSLEGGRERIDSRAPEDSRGRGR